MKTGNLIGAHLDWQVAKIEKVSRIFLVPEWFLAEQNEGRLCYSTDWMQAGPIIERECIELRRMERGLPNPRWVAQVGAAKIHTGPDVLVAAMRAYVASKYGDDVTFPKEFE